jgi:hypothetical protein
VGGTAKAGKKATQGQGAEAIAAELVENAFKGVLGPYQSPSDIPADMVQGAFTQALSGLQLESPPKGGPATAVGGSDDLAGLEAQIEAQAQKVTDMKAAGADKEVVTKEVGALLALKNSLPEGHSMKPKPKEKKKKKK